MFSNRVSLRTDITPLALTSAVQQAVGDTLTKDTSANDTNDKSRHNTHG